MSAATEAGSVTEPAGRTGLTTDEAARRLASHGPNVLVPSRRRGGFLATFARAITDPMTLLLLVAGPTYLALGHVGDAIVTFVALVPITAVSLVLETRAEHALEQLSRLTARSAVVLRDGQRVVMAADEIVPGDLVAIQEGDVVPADGVLAEGTQVLVDESALTGESQPVAKATAGAARELFAGTTVLSGRGWMEVTTTGTATRYGEVGVLVADIRQPPTPLQQTVRRLVLWLGAAALVLCVAVMGAELARGAGWGDAVIAGVSLGIATVPEELPLVYTLYLALGARRLARQHALVRRLAAVETLGSTTVICVDKTGTLTLGQLEVAVVVSATGSRVDDQPLDEPGCRLLEAAVRACEPIPFDPLEQSIVAFARGHGIDVDALHAGGLVRDYAFDPVSKSLTHVWRGDGTYCVAAKGSPESMLVQTADSETHQRFTALTHQLADEGMRVIAVCVGSSDDLGVDRVADESVLRFVGLVAFRDPLRPGVRDALRECGDAGIRVVMITGDHPVTAHAVAEGLELPHDDGVLATGDDLDAADDDTVDRLAATSNIFARIRPEQKYRLVRALKRRGEIVAMTGDGVNDAPALREADIGVALGRRGTEVAREAATIVLVDDNFATIVHAVRGGRRIFESLRRAFSYLISFHVPLLAAALLVPLVGRPLMLLPVHLILLQVVVHPTVALVFEHDPPADDVMRRRPRPPGTGLLTKAQVVRALLLGVTLSAAVLVLYFVRLGQGASVERARGLAFATMLLGQTVLVLVERSPDRPAWRASFRGNRVLAVVLATTIGGLVAVFVAPPLRELLKIAALSPAGWLVAIGAAVLATGWMEPVKAWRTRGSRRPAS